MTTTNNNDHNDHNDHKQQQEQQQQRHSTKSSALIRANTTRTSSDLSYFHYYYYYYYYFYHCNKFWKHSHRVDSDFKTWIQYHHYNNIYNNNNSSKHKDNNNNNNNNNNVISLYRVISNNNNNNNTLLRSIIHTSDIIGNSIQFSIKTNDTPTRSSDTYPNNITHHSSSTVQTRKISILSTILLSDLITLSIRTNLPWTLMKRGYKQISLFFRQRQENTSSTLLSLVWNFVFRYYYNHHHDYQQKYHKRSSSSKERSSKKYNHNNDDDHDNYDDNYDDNDDDHDDDNDDDSCSYTRTSREKMKRKRPPIISTTCLSGNAKGLPNYGQTCFLNSVLQALASFTPFIRYLERIVYVHYNEYEYKHYLPIVISSLAVNNEKNELIINNNNKTNSSTKKTFLSSIMSNVSSLFFSFVSTTTNTTSNRYTSITTSNDSSSSPFLLSQLLLSIFNHINCNTIDNMFVTTSSSSSSTRTHNIMDSSIPDPSSTLTIHEIMKSILHKIAAQNQQFNNGKSGSHHVNMALNEQQDAQELLLSLLSIVIKEAHIEEDEHDNVVDDDCNTRCCSRDETYPDSSKSDTGIHARLIQCNRNDDEKSSLSLFTIDDLYDEYDDKSIISNDNDNNIETERDDNDDPLSIIKSYNGGDKEGKESSSISDDHHKTNDNQRNNLVYSNSRQRRTELSTSIQMMINSVSKSMPSPLSICIGSTIQCCICKHVRSTKETPFLEIPIVPTSISNVFSSFSPVDKSSILSSSLSPCTLDQCLAEFTSIERVHEVDCITCSIQEELVKLEEKEIMLKNVIESLVAKKKRIENCRTRNNMSSQKRIQHEDDDEALMLLRRDLNQILERKMFLTSIDPDVYEYEGEENDEELCIENEFSFEGSINEYCFDVDKNFDQIGTALSKNGRRQKPPKPRKQDANKRFNITRLPPILCLHVKRLFFDPVTNRNTKSTQHITFPEYLDLTPYCARNVLLRRQVFHEHINRDNADHHEISMPSYQLMSVIEHRGNAFAGHYLTYRRVSKEKFIYERNENNISGSSSWVMVSDEKVCRVDWETVQKCEAYMLMYEAI